MTDCNLKDFAPTNETHRKLIREFEDLAKEEVRIAKQTVGCLIAIAGASLALGIVTAIIIAGRMM